MSEKVLTVRTEIIQSAELANCPRCSTPFVMRPEYSCGAEMGPHYEEPKEVPGYVIDMTNGFSDWDGPTKLAIRSEDLPPERTIWIFDDGCCAHWEKPEPMDEEEYCPKCQMTEWDIERSTENPGDDT